MAKRLAPLLNRVLVEKIAPSSKTNAGILLPEKSSKENLLLHSHPFHFMLLLAFLSQNFSLLLMVPLNSGRVIAVGPGIHDKEGKLIPVAVKEGDTVLLPEYGGTEVKLADKEYHLYRDDDILGTLHD